MFRPYPLFIGLRYTRARRRHQFISFVSAISLLGMIIGVMALIVVLSVMNGFAREMHERILRAIPHGYIEREAGIADWRALARTVEAVPGVVATAPFIGGNGMLNTPGRVRGAHLSGVLPEAERGVSEVADSMWEGRLEDLQPGEFGIVLGGILARGLGVGVGDRVTVILPRVTITPAGAFPRMKRFTVVGIFEVGAQVDSTEALIHLEDARRLFQINGEASGLRIQVQDMLAAETTLAHVMQTVPDDFHATVWTETQGGLFQAVKMEKTMVTLLLLIIVAVAAFNIVSILTMMVADKRGNIAVLRTLGATRGAVMSIFVVQGFAIGAVGVATGAVLGVLVALNIGDIVRVLEQLSGMHMFNPDVYFISRLPSVLEWRDVWQVCGAGLLLSALATLYPAWRASCIAPAEALRYE